MKRLFHEEKAQSLTEFALLIPILLILVGGIFDIFRMMYGYMHLHMAAQEAVRLAGLGKKDSEIITFVRGYVHIGHPDQLQITITPTESIRKSGEYVNVRLTVKLPYLTPFVSKILPSPSLTADSTIRVE